VPWNLELFAGFLVSKAVSAVPMDRRNSMSQRLRTQLAFSLTLVAALWGCGDPADPAAASSSPASPAGASSAVSFAGGAPSADAIGDPIGTVNGLPIGSKEFDQMAMRQMGRDGTVTEASRRDIMDRLVDEKLLYQEAVRRGIDKDPKIQKMMVNTLLKQVVYSDVRTTDIGDEDLQSYFDEHKEDFVVPEKVQIKRILVKADQAGQDAAALKAAADRIHAEVAAHTDDFKNLAQRYSKGPYARRGGDMGFVTRTGKPGVSSEIVEAAFNLAKGEVSVPFETADGWNIVYVPNRRERVERTFEQMRGSVLRKVKSERYKSLYDGFVDGLKGGANIDVKDEAYLTRAIESPAAPPAHGSSRKPGSGPAGARGAPGGHGHGHSHGPDGGHGSGDGHGH